MSVERIGKAAFREFTTEDGGLIKAEKIHYAPRAPEEARRQYPPEIEGTINAREVFVGVGARVGKDTVITGKNGPADMVLLGDFSIIGDRVKVIVPEFRLGDYSKLYAEHCHGKKPLQIGRNCWFGGGVVLDSMGGLTIADGCGFGAHTHVWTHIQFGDLVQGCNWYSSKPLHIPEDVWFVGECKVYSPAVIQARSMAFEGTIIRREMLNNHIYAGEHAIDITDRAGTQFADWTASQKSEKMNQIIKDFYVEHPEHSGKLVVVESEAMFPDDLSLTAFAISQRTYTKRYNKAEVEFLRATVPLVKFAPAGEPPFINPPQGVAR
ncbi:hypothetical protein C4564_04265 [Candidatus Microgenomates bacterium]|nr:MAG: hypothetical protein C4564_04265 [Candidatus Microgenomates bacterium]